MNFNYKAEVKGKGGIVVRIVADSISSTGKRLVTFEGEVHRSIWSEFMTHRLFSRNAMSSRAVPILKMLDNTKAVPIKFGAKKAGMVAGESHDEAVILNEILYNPDLGTYEWHDVKYSKEAAWEKAAESIREYARAFDEAGYHKGDINRLLEPFQHIKFVMTATELDNFMFLRRAPDAKEEIRELADCMYKAMEESSPEVLESGEWHVPYVNTSRDLFQGSPTFGKRIYTCDKGSHITLEEALAVSSSCCGQVSYRKIDNSFEKAMSIYEKLGVGSEGLHASPFEHQGTPLENPEPVYMVEPDHWEVGVTHIDRDMKYWSGNFNGWIQHRQLLDNHTCWEYKKE